MQSSKKVQKKTPEQYELISKFFELKDQVNDCDIFLSDIQTDYNMTINPRPQTLIDVQNYFKETEFVHISNLEIEEVPSELEILNKHLNDIAELEQKLDRLKIQIKTYFKKMEGYEKDSEVQEVKSMLVKIEKIKLHKKKKNKDYLKKQEIIDDVEINDLIDVCTQEIDEITHNLYNSLNNENNPLIEDISKSLKPDLLIILENKDDAQFLQESEINEKQIEKLTVELKNMGDRTNQIKNSILKWEKKNKKINMKKTKKKIERTKSNDYNSKLTAREFLLSKELNEKEKKSNAIFYNEMLSDNWINLNLEKKLFLNKKKLMIEKIIKYIGNEKNNEENVTENIVQKKIDKIEDNNLKKELEKMMKKKDIKNPKNNFGKKLQNKFDERVIKMKENYKKAIEDIKKEKEKD